MFSSRELRYRRWTVSDLTSIAPLLPGSAGGIYILGFTDGSCYVGQTTDMVRRFSAHRHGSRHHAAWVDIETLLFAVVPSDSLDAVERSEIIRLRRTGKSLRNRAWNRGHRQPSSLDVIISVDDQSHWATGGEEYTTMSVGMVPMPDPRGCGASRLRRYTDSRGQHLTYRKVISDFHCALSLLIPSCEELEGVWWTVSDLPSTAGGRYATLTVGNLELLYAPRTESSSSPVCVLNCPPGVVGRRWWSQKKHQGVLFRRHYRSATVDALTFPAGSLHNLIRDTPGLLSELRGFVLSLMRQASAAKIGRWHSPQLVSEMRAVGS
ncbi:GIY-YIG nuclease family protein [Corynebacterium marambiense]|uniref:GIY-YIG nuclease family protein n=1 Tax=Corynebacterium marambiense TaxID=2765364 RepID=UPI00361A41D4